MEKQIKAIGELVLCKVGDAVKKMPTLRNKLTLQTARQDRCSAVSMAMAEKKSLNSQKSISKKNL